jgi:FlaA1/EpsC-like NDP-sugar epimerase
MSSRPTRRTSAVLDTQSEPDQKRNKTSDVVNNNGTTTADALSESARRVVDDRNTLALHSLPTRRTPKLMYTHSLPDHKRLKILITGGAGFVGSHLTDKLMMEGHEVTVVDNFFTGSKKNVEHWLQHPNFTLVVHDITEPIRLVRNSSLYLHLYWSLCPPDSFRGNLLHVCTCVVSREPG